MPTFRLRPIKGGTPKLNFAGSKRAIREMLKKEAQQQNIAFRDIGKGWQNTKLSISSKGPIVDNRQAYVETGGLKPTKGNRVLSWLNFGTRKRPILPTGPRGLLVFRSGYSRSTRPGVVASAPKRRYGPYWFTKMVKKHQIEPREFDKAIAKQREGKMEANAAAEMRDFASSFWR